jgi:hypothetical protein
MFWEFGRPKQIPSRRQKQAVSLRDELFGINLK